MSIKRYSLAAIVLLAAAPYSSEAAGPEAAFNACTKAFVNTYLPNRIVRQQKTVDAAHSPLELRYTRTYTIALRAVGATSHTVLAEARCIADKKGLVLVLDTPPTRDYLAQADYTASLQ